MAEDKINLSYGSGGRLMHELIDSLFIDKLDNKILRQRKDSAIMEFGAKKIAFTTDSYVVKPAFFPGGDIGSLAVFGTANDLSVCGAKPLFLSLAVIIEEGFSRKSLVKIVDSIKSSCGRADVEVVTGDTKVVEKGSCDSIFINTSGIGEVYYNGLSVDKIKPGDSVIASGTLGEHAISVLSKREGMDFRSSVKSDSAPLNGLVRRALEASDKVRFMRDPTRGGLATTLNEIVKTERFGIRIDEKNLPVGSGVRYACELFGFDPLYLACEGRFVAIVAREDTDKVIGAVRKDELGRQAAVIGEVLAEYKGKVILNTKLGTKRMLDMLTGEQLPRIC